MMDGTQSRGIGSTLEQLLESKWTGWIINLVVIPALLAASLLLPPISLRERLFEAGFAPIAMGGGSVVDPDGTQVTLPAEGLQAPVRVRLTSIPRLEFLEGSAGRALRKAAESIPEYLVMRSPLYQVALRGSMPSQAILTIPIPNDSEPYSTLDIYAWQDDAWTWLPHNIIAEDDVIESHVGWLPGAFAVFQTDARAPSVGIDLEGEVALPANMLSSASEVFPQGLYMADDGSIVGDLPASVEAARQAGLRIIPTVRNWGPDGVVRSDLTDNMLISEQARQAHVQALVSLAVNHDFAGVEVYYRGVSPDLRAEFRNFIQALSDGLHTNGKLLSVRVDPPVQIAEDRWDTGAYDWVALGMAADIFRVEGLPNPDAWRAGGQMEQFLSWAVGQVDRFKLQPVLSAYSVEQVGNTYTAIPYSQALAAFTQVEVSGSNVINPGQHVAFALKAARESGGVKFDEALGTYVFSYTDSAGRRHTVYLENAASLAHKTSLLAGYNLRGVAVEHLAGEQNDELIWPVLQQYAAAPGAKPGANPLTATWTVRKSSGEPLVSESRPLDQPVYDWVAPQEPGEYVVEVAIAGGDGKTLVAGTPIAMVVASPTPTPTMTPTPTATPTPAPTATPKPKATATPKPQASAGESASPAPAPRNTSFGYGIQAHWYYTDHAQLVNHIKALGFNWTKQQVEWKAVESGGKGQYNWGELDRIVESCHANGINLLLSVVKAPAWARPPGADLRVEGPPANPQDFADFLSAMAARYKGKVQAYEIWNEQNLHYEWGNQPINAAQYMELLKAAYRAIKAVDPNAIVVSGALTPTGVNDGRTAIDDVVYLEQMYQNGLKNYSDAIGAHPSGYNNPPDAKFGYNDPAEPAFKNHPSFFFRETMERYRNVMVKYGDSNKKIWATEFGWASIENLAPSPAPGYEYAANVTEAEQAEYIRRAYEMGRNWGWVGVMFLWNLNYAPVAGPQDEKAAFSIVRSDWSQRPAFVALANMPK
jgi:spore germination protein YaaH